VKRYDRKTCQNRHDFFLSSPTKYHCRRSLTCFVGAPPAIFTISALLPPPFN